MNLSLPAPDLAQRLSFLMQALRAVIAARAGRDRAVVPVVVLLWPYLHRLAARFQALMRRLQAGGASAESVRVRPAAPRAARIPFPRLPRGVGWLIRLVPEAAGLAPQVRHWLADPELATLLAAAPGAGRILRPLCRMLGIEPGPDLPAEVARAPSIRPPSTPPAMPDPGSPAIAARVAPAEPA